MYSNSSAIFRGDIAGVLEQAAGWESSLIGTRVLPILPVDVRAGQYPVFQLRQGQLLKNDVKNRAPYSQFPRGTRSFTQDSYVTSEFGYEEAVDDVVQQDVSRFFNAEVLAAKLCQRKLLLAHELRVASTIFNNSTFTATNSGVAYTIANIATMNVALDVELAIDRLLGLGESRDNLRVVMSNQVWLRAKASTLFQNRMRGAGISNDTFLNASEQAAADVFGVREVIIGRASYDTAPEGVAFSGSQVWNNQFIWIGSVSESGGGYFGGGAGFTLAWAPYGPVTGVFTYRDEAIKSNILRASQHVTEKIVNANAGQLITTQYS